MTFTLTIGLGNDAMQNGADVAKALTEVAGKMDDGSFFSSTSIGTKWPIRDLNGNRVGTWTVERDEDDEEGTGTV